MRHAGFGSTQYPLIRVLDRGGRYEMNVIMCHPGGCRDEKTGRGSGCSNCGRIEKASTPWAGASLLVELYRRAKLGVCHRITFSFITSVGLGKRE